MPLEFNLDKLNAISYDKGCYIGQVGGLIGWSTTQAGGWEEDRLPAGRQLTSIGSIGWALGHCHSATLADPLCHITFCCAHSLQEFVARVHSRGVVRKRVMPFRLGEARGASCRSSGAAACSAGCIRPLTHYSVGGIGMCLPLQHRA